MTRRLILAALAVALAALAGCGSFRPPVYACGTDTLPPVAVDPIVCHNGLPAVRWWSATEGTPPPQPGLPMDWSWYTGGRGSIGYGPGYDPRPREVWIRETRYLPYREPARQVPAEPPAARATVDTIRRGGLGVPTGKGQVDPPKPAAKQTARPAPRTTNR